MVLSKRGLRNDYLILVFDMIQIDLILRLLDQLVLGLVRLE